MASLSHSLAVVCTVKSRPSDRCLQPCSLFNSEPLTHSPVQVDELRSAAKASAAKLKRASDLIMRLEAEVGAIPSTGPAHVKTAAVLSASIARACHT